VDDYACDHGKPEREREREMGRESLLVSFLELVIESCGWLAVTTRDSEVPREMTAECQSWLLQDSPLLLACCCSGCCRVSRGG
jgi:hypothetical protein